MLMLLAVRLVTKQSLRRYIQLRFLNGANKKELDQISGIVCEWRNVAPENNHTVIDPCHRDFNLCPRLFQGDFLWR